MFYRYTSGKSADGEIANQVYAIILSWPEKGEILLNVVTASPTTKVSFLGYPGAIKVIYKIDLNFQW